MVILFQGDSITDCGRSREDLTDLGPGYPHFAAEMLREKYPNVDFTFINRGISGNKTDDLVARWKEDAIDLQPDIVSIMIGVNDTWHHIGLKDFETDSFYENNYRNILQQLRDKTSAKILILEQYIIPNNEKELEFYDDMGDKILITRRLAREYAEKFIPLDGLFAAACVEKPWQTFSDDGVHPNETGARFIANLYVEAISPMIDALLAK